MRKFLALIVCLFAVLRLSATDYTIYFQNSAGWSEVYCYAWSGENKVLGAWPGTKVTESTTYNGTTYLKVTVPDAGTGYQVIFNNNGGSQSPDGAYLVNGGVYNAYGKVRDSLEGTVTPPEVSDLKPTGTLPVVYINCTETGTSGQLITDYNLRDKDYRAGTYWIDAKGLTGFENLGSAEAPLPLEIKARGNYTRSGFAKKPFKIKLGAKASPLGLTKSKHFALLNHPDDDMGYLRNFVGFWLGRAMYEEDPRMWSPREVPVELVINGDYRGIYFLTESIRVDKDRINIQELDDNATDQALISGGYLVELDNYADENTIQVYGDENTGDRVWVTPDTPELYTPVMSRFVSNQFKTMTDLIKSHSDDTWKYLDIDAAARYYIIMEVLSHWEAYHGSTYLYRDRGDLNKWIFSPLWDLGHAFDSWGNNRFIYEQGMGHYGNTWIADMVKNDKFMEKVRKNWQWFWGNKVDDLFAAIDSYAVLVAPAAAMDHKRWDGLLPQRYNDPLNHDKVTNPSPVQDNTDMQAKKSQAVSNLRAKIDWLAQQWGNPVPGMAMPEADDTPAQPLPDYMRPDYVPTAHKVYYKSNPAGKVNAKIWIWSDAGAYFTGGWDNRPSMYEAVDADGEVYYWYEFDDLSNPYFKITEDNDDAINDTNLVPGTLYIKGGETVADWDPSKATPKPKPLMIYLYDKAGWCADNTTPTCYVYIDNTVNNGWDTQHMTRMPVGTRIGDYTATADKAIFSFEVEQKYNESGKAIFYKDDSHRYPADGVPGMEIAGKSHIFVNDDSHSWTEVVVEDPWSGALPVLHITTADGAPVPADKSSVAASAYIDNVASGETWSVGSADAPVAVKKLKGHGSSSWTDFDKKPYKLQFAEKQTFGSMPKSKHYLLMPYAADGELDFLRNITGHEISKAIGLSWTPSQVPVEVMLNGEYLGLYFLVENIRPAGARVRQFDFQDLEAPRDEWRNFIVEIDNTKQTEPHKTVSDGSGHELRLYSDSFDFDKPDWNDLFPADGKEAMLATVRSDFDHLTSMFGNSLRDLAAQPDNNLYWMYGIDRHEAAAYCLVQEIMDDPNAFTTAFYMTYTAQDDKGEDLYDAGWRFGPVWDFSHAFASRDNKTALLSDYDGVPLVSTLYACDDFYSLLITVYDDFTVSRSPAPRRVDAADASQSEFPAGSRLAGAWDNVVAQYTKYQPALNKEYARWQGQYSATGQAAPLSDGSALQTVKSYLLANHALLRQRLSTELLTSVGTVGEDADAPVEYFDITGRRILTPTPGTICIRRQGAKVQKLIIR